MRARTRLQLGLLVFGLVAPSASTARADPAADRDVIVIGRDGARDPAVGLGGELVRQLDAQPQIARAEASPTSMRRLALAAGCEHDAPECGGQIARTVSATIVVWRLDASRDGPRLVLSAFPPDAGRPSTVSVRADDDAAAGRAVSALMSELGADPGERWEREPRRRQDEDRFDRAPSSATLATLGLGTAVFVGGVSLAVAARDGEGDSATRRARGGYAMLSMGSALLAVGGTLLTLQLTAEQGSPWRGGVSLGDDAAVAWLRGPIGP